MKNRIGIVGGGQLARMLIFEAKKMGFVVTVLDPSPLSPGGQVADEQIVADLDDEKAMQTLSEKSDFITIEWELANDKLLEQLEEMGKIVNPSPKTLRIIKDKLSQKEFLKKNKIPVAEFEEIKNKKDVTNFSRKFGYPFLLKSRFGGYDGRGNALIKNEKDIDVAFQKMKNKRLYIEEFVPFNKEISVIVARDIKGNIATYPVGENIHKNNILDTTIVPARISKKVEKKAILLAENVLDYLKGAGVFAIEMFVIKDKVLVNEIAPRVHNSGHYTIESCITSQFEQHIRAIANLPLGKTDLTVKAVVMTNILGNRIGKADVQNLEKALKIPGVSIHIYGKTETKPERKMGHITAIGQTVNEALNKAKKARELISV